MKEKEIKIKTGKGAFALSGLFFLFGLLFLLWSVSSSHLSFLECEGNYSFSAETFNCRGPVIYAMFFYFFMGLFAVFLLVGIHRRQKLRKMLMDRIQALQKEGKAL
ncbi:MAG: hypothetical protein OEV42_18830 [Deltaproteobacteria bacterium]|nr:hypothetical protein [Deltaproteobacteria bacterium]